MASLRYKIGLEYFVLVCISIGTSIFAVYNFSRLGGSVGKIFRENYQSVLAAENMVKALERQEHAQFSMFVDDVSKSLEQFNKNRDEFFRWYQKGIEGSFLPVEPTILDSIIATYRLYLSSSDSLYQIIQRRDAIASAKVFQFNSVRPIASSLKEQCFHLLEVNHNAIIAADRQAKSMSNKATLAVVAGSAIAMLLSIIASIHFARSILRAQKLAHTVRQISQGHLNQKIDVTTDDEIGDLSREFNKMTERLKNYEEMNIQQLIAEKKKSEAIVASIPDPVLVTDENNRLLIINQAAAKILDSAENWQGKPVSEILKNEHLSNFFSQALDERAAPDKLIPITNGESTHYFRPRQMTIQDEHGRRRWSVTMFQDVTQFKKLDQMKSEFMATVSHEFRTPLTSVNMSVDILMQEVLGSLNERQLDLLSSAKQDCERLTKLVKELLDLSRLESGKYPTSIESINLHNLIETAINPLRLPFQEKGVQLELSIEPSLPDFPADQRQLTWVITNLLSNALRYTDAGGRVTISGMLHQNVIIVAVSDTGRGIPKNAVDAIFDKFVQVKQAADSTPGSVGLGLAIAKEVIESYGGKIWVESEIGRGSTFYFTVPNERKS